MKLLHSAFTAALLAAGVLGTTPLTPERVADDIEVQEFVVASSSGAKSPRRDY